MDLKEEIHVLNASAELIEGFVNHEVCVFHGDEAGIVDSVWSINQISEKYFYILLLDLITVINSNKYVSKDKGDNALELMKKIAISPELEKDVSKTSSLKLATETFTSWLSHEFEYEIYGLPSVL